MKLLIASDICTHYFREKTSTAFARELYAQAQPLFDRMDYRVANLEFTLRREGQGQPIVKEGPNLYDTPACLPLFTLPPFDAVTLANNHTGDFGPECVPGMLKTLEESGIAHVGCGMNKEEAYRALRTEKDGVSVSLLSICENEFGCAEENRPGSAGFDLYRLLLRIREEKAASDFVIVIFHGGNEQDPLPSPDTVDRYRTIAELGADAVIAMHTHCMQGFENYQGRPIVYSMGNFFFPKGEKTGPSDPWNWGYMSELTLEKGQAVQLDVHPYRLEKDRLELFTGKQKQSVLAYLAELSGLIGDRAALQTYFDAWCTVRGTAYAKNGLRYDTAYENGAAEVTHPRNLFWCEAHCSLMKNLLKTELEGRFGAAREKLDELARLAEMPKI